MGKRIYVILILVICVVIPTLLLTAATARQLPGQNLSIYENFKIEIFSDGKITDDKMVVELRIYDYRDDIHAYWNHVYIRPIHDFKKIILKSQHFSTQEKSIKDVRVTKNSFSFTIDLSGTFGGAGRAVQVVGSKKEGELFYSVEGTGLWWSEILKKSIKTEWRSTDKKFILPYKEVF